MVVYALKHDLAEVILGDVPTPTKERMAKAGYNYRDIEWSIMINEFPPGMNKLPAETKTIIKTADRMEALWFIQTYGIGRHAAAVIEDMNSKMGAYYEMLSPRVEEAARQVWKEMTTGDIMI